MMHEKVLKFIVLSFISLLTMVIVFWGVQWFSTSVTDMLINSNNLLQGSLKTSVENAQASMNSDSAISQNLLPLRNWQTEDLKIDAQSAISVEIGAGQQKVLFKKDEEKKLPMASLTKLMTALVVLDNYDLSSKVIIDELSMTQEGEQGGVKLGQVFTVKDLLHITLMESSNKSAFALSKVAGTDKFIWVMNENAKKIGLSNTHFQDTTGLDEGSYSTASDLVKLTQYLFEHYPLFGEIINQKEYDLYLPDGTFHHKLINTNQILGENNVVGGKTGYTEIAKGCFMVIQKNPGNSNYVISVILGANDRVLEMKKLIQWMDRAYKFEL